MKVLWFTNTPSLAHKYLNETNYGGGWLSSLENEIIKDETIQLAIAFTYRKKLNDFQYGNTHYYPISNKHKYLNKLYKIIFNTDEGLNETKEYLKIIEDYKPDIIHIHGTEKPYIKILEYSKLPVVVSIQGNLTVYNYFNFRGISFWKVLIYEPFATKILFNSFLRYIRWSKKSAKREKIYLKLCKYIIGRTDWDKRITRVLAPESIYFHNDEVLRNEFYINEKTEYTTKKNNFIIVTTTSSSLRKGIESIYETVLLLKRFSISFTWTIIGLNKSDALIKTLRKIYGTEPEKYIEFLGKCSENEIIDQLINSDLYVMVSHIENSPNNLCEAMMTGVPCIATDSGGTSSLIDNNKDGLLIQDGDPYSLAGAILEMFNDPDKLFKTAINGKERAKRRHNKQEIVNNLKKIYYSIINDHR